MTTRAIRLCLGRPFLSAALLLGSLTLQAQGSEAVLSRHVQAVGGMEKLNALHSIRFTGVLTVAPGVDLPLIQEEARPNKTRISVQDGAQTYLTVFDGKQGFSSSPATQGQLKPFTPAELAEASRQTFDGDLVNLPARGAVADSIGRQMIQGRDAYGIKVTEQDGTRTTHWIDVQNYMEIQRERDMDTSRGRRTQVMRFSDFRIVEGLAMPFRIETGFKFSSDSQLLRITKVDLNPTLPDSDFEPPSAP